MEPAAATPPVVLDLSRLVGRAWQGRQLTGVDRVATAYAEHFFHQDPAHTRALLRFKGLRRVLRPKASLRLHSLLSQTSRHGSAGLRTELTALLATSRADASLNDTPVLYPTHTGVEHPGLVPWVQRTGQRAYFFLHDLIPLTHPQYCRADTPAVHAARVQHMVACGNGILVNSQATRDDLIAHAQAHQWWLPPVLVAPLGTAAAPEVTGSCASIDDSPPYRHPYFVMLGTLEGRKNHLMVLQVWQRLIERHGAQAPHLVLIGARGWACDAALHLLDHGDTLKGHVHELGACSDAVVHRTLRHARALLFPSFAEGYGLPLVEALQQGTPVIASPLAAFEEVAGSIPSYAQPTDSQQWLALIEAYTANDSPTRAAQVQRMQGFVPPTWHAHFEAVRKFITCP